VFEYMTTMYVFALQVPMVSENPFCKGTPWIHKKKCYTSVLADAAAASRLNTPKIGIFPPWSEVTHPCHHVTELYIWSSEKHFATCTLHIAFIAALPRMIKSDKDWASSQMWA
jgi:hypothetical protein